MLPDNRIRPTGNPRQLTEYLKKYAGTHKATTIRVYTAIHTLGGGILPVDTIIAKAEVSRRTFNSAVKTLRETGLLEVQHRFDTDGKPVWSRYVLSPVSVQKPRSLDRQVSAYTARTCASTDVLQEIKYLEEEQDLGEEIGLDLPSGGTAASGGVEAPPQVPEEGRPGTEEGPRNSLAISETRPVTLDDCKKPLADPDLESVATEILDLIDKLRVRDGARPISVGSRPGQLTSARLLVAFDRVSAPETLAGIRWAFSGAAGSHKWAKAISKPFELRRIYPKFIEEYRKALVADIGMEPTVITIDRTPEQKAELARKLMEHR